ncbi:hypothetical protein AAF712_011939 [Marasmius tenuissimus]|uniref:Uncharacterized protein n=1 Tax=Marasmius tenuissimus TaxID=585030 RepID=A0ABR2ZHS5_9AGAR
MDPTANFILPSFRRGHDLAPSKSQLSGTHLKEEAIPKSAARVLNALKIREDYRKRKREGGDGDEDTGGRQGKKRKKTKAKGTGDAEVEKGAVGGILPGESLEHYNKRVEQNMRPLVRDAVKTSLAVARSAKKQDEVQKATKKGKPAKKTEDTDDSETPSLPDKHASKAKEFQALSTSAPKRLNDIVQAPPEMPRLRGAEKVLGRTGTGVGKRGGVVSMAQKVMMEEEREKAIKRYREMKARAREEKDTAAKDP